MSLGLFSYKELQQLRAAFVSGGGAAARSQYFDYLGAPWISCCIHPFVNTICSKIARHFKAALEGLRATDILYGTSLLDTFVNPFNAKPYTGLRTTKVASS